MHIRKKLHTCTSECSPTEESLRVANDLFLVNGFISFGDTDTVAKGNQKPPSRSFGLY